MKITEWEFNRIGNDVEYLYVTSNMRDDEDYKRRYITSIELCDFIVEDNLNEVQVDVDKFINTNDWNYLMDNFDYVATKFFEQIYL